MHRQPYTALLVLLTQYMALRNNSSPSSFLGIITVTIYLVCISTLHITTPSLLSVQSFNLTDAGTVPVTVGMPVVNNSASSQSQTQLWGQAASFLTYGNTNIQYLSTIGLANSTIYDTIRPGGGLVEVTVNATTANVTCGCIPNATAILVSDYLLMVDAVYGRYHFTVYTDPGDGPGAGLVYTALSVPMCGRSALFLTTLNVTDDEEQAISTVKGNYNGSSSLPLQLLGCTLGWTKGVVVVDGATRQPAASLSGTNFDLDNRPSIRTTWEPDLTTDSTQVDDSDSWALCCSILGPLGSLMPISSESISYQEALWPFRRYLEEVLGLATFNGTHAVRLTAFEAALSKMTAVTYWSAAHLTLDDLFGTARGSYNPHDVTLLHHSRRIQVAVGLGASSKSLRTARSHRLSTNSSHAHHLARHNEPTLNQRIAGIEGSGMTDLGSFSQPDVLTETEYDKSEQWQDGDSHMLSQSQGRHRENWVYTAVRDA
ncbi:uncharacterized protein B0H18DRAFT_1024786 [Fomitopsis serialis]|uniref:uncharacterized protein n=1 Tax=Fomitopsis serialis TaxID=139415 RepID=UPI002008A4C9|nr:uncharacterized protein B0H18DRAFT_1024786 [Neoantrodia serialis]KAH9920313.1 hypothetical protein B0H18DRAFT_1024786 [Neoantrodia serialis]